MKLYCDTSVLPSHIRKPAEREAFARLEQARDEGLLELVYAGHLRREADKTPCEEKRSILQSEYKSLTPVLNDEVVVGFSEVRDQYGGGGVFPRVQDVQDPAVLQRLVDRGLTQMDAGHIAQAIANKCQYFVTLDCKTIIKPHGRWIEEQFPPLKVQSPSQVAAELDRQGLLRPL